MVACIAGLIAGATALAAVRAHTIDSASEPLERSYWLHASLAADTRHGYWGADFPLATAPSESEIKRAASLLSGTYAANRLYLIYHGEIPWDEARRVMRAWSRSLPRSVEVVPALVLRMYDSAATPVFGASHVQEMARWFRGSLSSRRVAVYDVYPKRDQGEALPVLAREFPRGLIRLGLQPGEPIGPPFVAAVEDTWSGMCHGRSNGDWLSPGFGADTLGGWIKERNADQIPISWDLVAVAWDYLPTKRGEYPGYDDGNKNMPLPDGRNTLAVGEIMRLASPGLLAGFSSDLFILQVNSATAPHDGVQGAFYETLKRGVPYRGYYAKPFAEIGSHYRVIRAKGPARDPLP